MDIGNSDAESPEPAAGPANPVWSPQYSPAKLAELVPVNHSTELSPPPHNGMTSGDHAHSRGSAELHGLSHSGHMHHSQGFTQLQGPHQHQLQGSYMAPGHADLPLHQEPNRPSGGHVTGAASMPNAAALQVQSPSRPRALPDSMQHTTQFPSHSLTMHPSMTDPSSVPPHPPGKVYQPANMTQEHQQQAEWRPNEQMMPDHHGQPLRAGPLHSAPGSAFDQSEQQLHQLTYSPTRQETFGMSSHHPSSQLGTRFQPDRQQHSMPTADQCYNPEEPQMHSDVHAGHGRQAYVQEQGLLSHSGNRVEQGNHASAVPQLHAGQQMMSGQHPHAVLAGSLPAGMPNFHAQDRQDQVAPLPRASALPGHAVQRVGHADHQTQLSHPLLPQAQSATVLSPELSAALAAGMLGDQLTSSTQRLPVQYQHQPERSHQQQPQHQQLPGGRNSASALPAELSAALASGQLHLQLTGSNHTPSSQQAAFQPEQAAFQPTPAVYQPEQAAFQPGQPAGQAAFQPQQAGFPPEQPVLHSEAAQWTRQHPHANAGRDDGRQPPSQPPFHLNPVASAHYDSHTAPSYTQPSHAGVSGPEAAMQMSMSSPSLQTQPRSLAAASHGGPSGRLLSVSSSDLQQGAVPHQYPQHEHQHVWHGSQPAQQARWHSQQEQPPPNPAYPLPYHAAQPMSGESTAQLNQAPRQHRQHEVQRPAEHAEHWDRPHVLQPEYPSEQPWQARTPDHGKLLL